MAYISTSMDILRNVIKKNADIYIITHYYKKKVKEEEEEKEEAAVTELTCYKLYIFWHVFSHGQYRNI